MARGREVKVAILGDEKNFNRAFDKAEKDVASLDRSFDKASDNIGKSSKKMGDKISAGFEGQADKFGDKGKEFGLSLAEGIGAGGLTAGTLFVAGLTQAMDNERASGKLAAQLGATGDWARELGTIAGDLYTDAYGESLDEVGEALRNVLQNSLVSEDATNETIEKITAKVLDTVATFGVDIALLTAAISNIIRNGLAPDADKAIDVLVRGFQQGANKSDDLLDTFNEYAPIFKSLGIDAETATGLLIQGLKGGARDADTVADALKEFSIRAKDSSDTTADGFKRLGLKGKDMGDAIAAGGDTARYALGLTLGKLKEVKDPVERNAIAVELFGTKAEDLQGALGALDTGTAVQQLGNIAGAADEMGQQLNDNAGAKIEAFKREKLQALSEWLVENGPDLWNSFINGLKQLDQWQQNVGKFISDAENKVNHFWLLVVSVKDKLAEEWDQIADKIASTWEVVRDVLDTALGPFDEIIDRITRISDLIDALPDPTNLIPDIPGLPKPNKVAPNDNPLDPDHYQGGGGTSAPAPSSGGIGGAVGGVIVGGAQGRTAAPTGPLVSVTLNAPNQELDPVLKMQIEAMIRNALRLSGMALTG